MPFLLLDRKQEVFIGGMALLMFTRTFLDEITGEITDVMADVITG
jgi:hypothetical protein